MYWLWRTHWAGHELMHGSVIDTAGRPMYTYAEVQKTAADFAKAADFLNRTHVSTRVALHYPSTSWNFFQTQNMVNGFQYSRSVLDCYYRPMIDLGLRPDVLETDMPLDGYDLIFTPFVPYLGEEGLDARLRAWVEQGGVWVVGPMTDIRDADGVRFLDRPLGMLEEFANVYLAHSLPCTNEAYICETSEGRVLQSSIWYELYESTDGSAACVTHSPHSTLNGKSVLVRKSIGKGTVFLLGFIPSAQDMKELILPMACKAAGISFGKTEGNSLMVIPRTGKDCSGMILAEFNGSGGSCQLDCAMYEHLSGKTLQGRVEVAPYEVLILERL